MKAPDRAQFLKAMEREIKGHEEGNHWVLVPKHQVPKGTKVLMQFGLCVVNVE